MKNNTIAMILTALGCSTLFSSCIIQHGVSYFIRDTYPGERPPHVIADNNGKPASQQWLKIDPYALPPAGGLTKNIEKAEDGLPYGLPCEFSNIVVSPYDPHYQLDYTNCKVGDKVWDPYTRKPFYIPRMYTFN